MYPIIIIPAYQPEQKLIVLVEALLKNASLEILIVNDGSDKKCAPIFTHLKRLPQVTVLEHAVNLGKGQALKTAFNYFLTHFDATYRGVLTADADGQHLPEDIMNLATAFSKDPQSLYLGARAFDKDVPWKSRIGNNLTKLIFRLLIQQSLQDTQTGLRAIPRDFLKNLLKTPSNGYEFELDMLIKATKQNLTIKELTIKTVYNDQNRGSHFNPVIDSLKIYFVFLRFLVFAAISGLIDFLAFSLAFFLCGNILVSESLARVFSGTCNFLFNKELVFKSKANLRFEALKYALLCVVNLVFSYAFIQSLVYFGANVYASKLIALFGLFIANFAIQKLLVFNQTEDSLKGIS
ncbi:MAG: glycosyltransferase [Candidatus Berkiella sp.]|jgi:glycosyltransferase involved in cell wall biosynthesis